MIKLGIVGYGNLGRAVIDNLKNFKDFELCGIFTRRPNSVKADYPVYSTDDLSKFVGKIDCLIMCGGSATDLGEQTPAAAKMFNLVDSFDTHALIPSHLQKVDNAAKESGKIAVISAGWDPGLFSMARAIFSAYLPAGKINTFWGKGVSQGHSDAIRRVNGVAAGVQYTIPKQDALNAVRANLKTDFTTREKHLRECFVVAIDGADKAKIEAEIKAMPNYFTDYDTVVNFISKEEFDKNHTAMPHGGSVISAGESSAQNKNVLEMSIKLDSNPHFTSSILLAYARAAVNLNKQGNSGAKTVFDIPVSALFKDRAELIKNLL